MLWTEQTSVYNAHAYTDKYTEQHGNIENTYLLCFFPHGKGPEIGSIHVGNTCEIEPIIHMMIINLNIGHSFTTALFKRN